MRKLSWIVLVAVVLLGGRELTSWALPAQDPAKKSCAETALKNYHDRGGYERGVRQVFEAAWERVERSRQGDLSPAKPAVVMDIDDTSLSNYATIAADGFCMNYENLYASWEKEATPIPAALEFFKKARAAGVDVFFITGRSERHRAVSEAQLAKAGFAGFKQLFLKPDGDRTPSAQYKAAARKSILDQGYRILANIGDQPGDLEGENADRAFLVPNPFYGS